MSPTESEEDLSSELQVSQDAALTGVVFTPVHAGEKRCCSYPGCAKRALSRGRCYEHGGGIKCSHPSCTKQVKTGGKCTAHGGGYRCKYPGCNKHVLFKDLCFAHGGRRKCKQPGCTKVTQSNGWCTVHGGRTQDVADMQQHGERNE